MHWWSPLMSHESTCLNRNPSYGTMDQSLSGLAANEELVTILCAGDSIQLDVISMSAIITHLRTERICPCPSSRLECSRQDEWGHSQRAHSVLNSSQSLACPRRIYATQSAAPGERRLNQTHLKCLLLWFSFLRTFNEEMISIDFSVIIACCFPSAGVQTSVQVRGLGYFQRLIRL